MDPTLILAIGTALLELIDRADAFDAEPPSEELLDARTEIREALVRLANDV